MTRTLTFSAFAIASLLTMFGFITAKSYSQLAIAAVLYPALIYIALNIFPRNNSKVQKIYHQIPKPIHHKVEKIMETKETVNVANIDKRDFIKLILMAGASFFVFSLLGRGVEALIFNKNGSGPNTNASLNNGNNQNDSTNVSPTDGYKISEIDQSEDINYIGYINKDGNWLVMRQDTNDNTFRYAKGASNFPENWANRAKLRYDYYSNIFD